MDLSVESLITSNGSIDSGGTFTSAADDLVQLLQQAHNFATATVDWVTFAAVTSARAKSTFIGGKLGLRRQDNDDGGTGETSGGEGSRGHPTAPPQRLESEPPRQPHWSP